MYTRHARTGRRARKGAPYAAEDQFVRTASARTNARNAALDSANTVDKSICARIAEEHPSAFMARSSGHVESAEAATSAPHTIDAKAIAKNVEQRA